MKNDYVGLLRRNPEYSKLWIAQVVSLLGDWFNTVALSALVAQFTEGSGLAISFFLLSRFLAPLLVRPFAGVLIDRYNRKWLMIWSNLLRALIVPLFLLADSPEQLWLIYGVTIIQFALSAIFEPCQSAIIPALLQPDDLVRGNTLINVTWSVMLALGALLGGAFSSLFGREAAIIFDALTFLLASGIILWVRYVPFEAPKTDEKTDDTRFVDGLRFLQKTPMMRWTLFIKLGSTIGNMDTLYTIIATQVFILGTGGELSLGIMYSVYGLGAFIGPLVINRWNDGNVETMRRLVMVGFLLITASWFWMGASTTLVWLCVGIFVRAMGGSVNWTYSTILVQKTAPNRYLGRMFSLDFMGFEISTVLTVLIHGALIDILGVQAVTAILLGTGVVALVPMLIWWTVYPRLNATPAPSLAGTD